MKCPFCGYGESRVVDSRPTDDGERIRRRRECLSCNKRFTTYEMIESLPIIVIKKDKTREAFNREKLRNGILNHLGRQAKPDDRPTDPTNNDPPAADGGGTESLPPLTTGTRLLSGACCVPFSVPVGTVSLTRR